MAQQKIACVQECLCRHRVFSSLHASRSTGACAAAHAPAPPPSRCTVTSLRAAFAAMPSCVRSCS
ncbi:hypothetical protein DB771_20900 [Burkholderia sp. AU29985]|nr:hypothetical protein EGY28_08135 [Burkholderia dolosa]PRE49877.1 hypothetical protein C6P87_12970 [Burkholderia sp. AU12872]PUA74771.1 hypothetical protein DB771_20900 [Burkholderia sp. AU29985]